MFRDTEDQNNTGGNISTEKVTAIKVEEETVNVVYTEKDGKTDIQRIEYPESRTNDKDWIEKAQKKINLTSLESKNNLDRKKLLADINDKQANLDKSKKALSNLLSPQATDDFDLQKAIMKNLDITDPAEIAEADADDLKKARTKAANQMVEYDNQKAKGLSANNQLSQTIVEENTPDEVVKFVSWVKDLGVKNITPSIYNAWKSTKPKDVAAGNQDIDVIAGIQMEHIPFVPAGSEHTTSSKTAQIHKGNFETMKGLLGKV